MIASIPPRLRKPAGVALGKAALRDNPADGGFADDLEVTHAYLRSAFTDQIHGWPGILITIERGELDVDTFLGAGDAAIASATAMEPLVEAERADETHNGEEEMPQPLLHNPDARYWDDLIEEFGFSPDEQREVREGADHIIAEVKERRLAEGRCLRAAPRT